MKTKIASIGMALFLLMSAGQAAEPAEPTEQEKVVLTQLREVLTKQMGRPPTPEEEQRALDQYRQSVIRASVFAARMQNLAAGGATSPSPAATAATETTAGATAPSVSEESLAKKIADLGPGKANAKVVAGRDGFKVDGVPFLDPEGTVKSMAFDGLSGDITYAIQAGGNWVYKFMKAGTDAVPVTFATGRMSPGAGWQILTVTGKQLNGDTVTPISRGLMVGRAGAAFRYEPGQGSKGAAIPDGWVMAQFQRGNVGGTRYILIERIVEPASGGGFGGLFNVAQSLGATVGLNKKEDYALLNLDTGKQYPLNVQVDGKQRAVMSNCRKRNSVVNECRTVNSTESLYSDVGRNWGHYYWKVIWYNTPAGPVAVTLENGVKDAYLLDLNTGKKVTAFHRGLGLSSLDSVLSPDGKLSVMADWMFETHKIDDALAHLRDNPDATASPPNDSKP